MAASEPVREEPATPSQYLGSVDRSNQLANAVAQLFAGQDWHQLSSKEQAVVTMLEESGHLSHGRNGFVGRAISR